MQLVAKWQDSRNKVTYRLCADAKEFVLEKEAKDALGDSTWRQVDRFDKAGSSAGLHSILAIGLEEVQNSKGYGRPPHTVAEDARPTPLDQLLNLL